MELSLEAVLDGVIAKGAGNVLFGGAKLRGPLATADFIYECMIGVALEFTNRLPMMFEHERQKYCQHQKFFREHGFKGKYTDSYGWTKNLESKMDFSFSPAFYNYFNRIITPFLGGKKKGWCDGNSKIWKYVKRLIISGDKEKIAKLQTNIRNRILKESKKRIRSYAVGTNHQESFKKTIIQSSNI